MPPTTYPFYLIRKYLTGNILFVPWNHMEIALLIRPGSINFSERKVFTSRCKNRLSKLNINFETATTIKNLLQLTGKIIFLSLTSPHQMRKTWGRKIQKLSYSRNRWDNSISEASRHPLDICGNLYLTGIDEEKALSLSHPLGLERPPVPLSPKRVMSNAGLVVISSGISWVQLEKAEFHHALVP